MTNSYDSTKFVTSVFDAMTVLPKRKRSDCLDLYRTMLKSVKKTGSYEGYFIRDNSPCADLLAAQFHTQPGFKVKITDLGVAEGVGHLETYLVDLGAIKFRDVPPKIGHISIKANIR